MRRAGPLLILVFGLFALIVDFVPVTMPSTSAASSPTKLETKLGLDLRGGLRVEYQVLPAEGKIPSRDDLNVMRQIIINRIDKSGVSEPQVVVQGTDRIVIEMPGVQNADQIRNLVGTTGALDFVPLGTTAAQQGQQLDPKVLATACDATTTVDCVLFDGKQIAAASIGANATGQRTVNFVLKDQGKQLFADYTAKHIGDFFAIVLDGAVISAPTIRDSIPGGQVEISQNGIGGYPLAEAQNLVTILQFGQLPYPLKELANTTVSPTLGDEFLRQSLLAGLIAVFLVVLFMVVHYRLPGVVASGALMYYALVVYALFRLVPVTMTLAGIAGLITATILFLFGTSTIRGFGLVLIIGVLTSMFTAITVTRTMLRIVVAQPWARKAGLYGVTEAEFLARPVSGRGSLRGEARGRV